MRVWQWVERKLAGHVSFGRVTLYGANAMHWGVNIWTRRWGYVCFRLPLPCCGCWWPLYFYCSPNATPWAATFFVGRDKYARNQRALSRARRDRLGHNFDTSAQADALRVINGDV